MRVLLDLRTTAEPVVGEPDDLTHLHVEATAVVPDDTALAARLERAGAGAVDGEDVLLKTDWLRGASPGRARDWHDRFDGMLAYARSQGWSDEAGRTVRAHVAWVAPAQDGTE